MNPSKLIDLSCYRSILCLDGALPRAAFFEEAKLPIIAADGAANTLERIGVTPDIIVGDLDSVDPRIIEHVTHILLPSQDHSDFQKAITYMEQNSLLPSIICGVNGGYLDHVINNVNVLLSTDSVLLDDDIAGFIVAGRREFILPLKSKLSIFGIPNCTISSTGLKWELNHHTLTFPGSASCSNRTVSDSVTLEIHEGKALVLIYLNDIKDAGYW
ncbi:MAG: thiamine diphosphokinase [Holosporales bacterium]|jgi:thiamine pyrophosphokinase|nr:thiamine diphosphokinase [Holosporales bacterium]